MWLALGVYFFFVQAGEIFADARTRAHEVECWKGADVAFFEGETQLAKLRWSTVDRVEVRVRDSKGDQLRSGTLLSH